MYCIRYHSINIINFTVTDFACAVNKSCLSIAYRSRVWVKCLLLSAYDS